MTRKTNQKTNQNNDDVIIDFGKRRVNKQNKSRTLVLPKPALKNLCGSDDATSLQVKLVQSGNEKYIKLANCTAETSDSEK